MASKKLNLEKYIRSIPDFPKPGILFRDITTLLAHKQAFKTAIKLLADKFKKKKIDYVVAVEARGFILGGAIAEIIQAGFVPVRKKGKLPWRTKSVTYNLEYGTDTLEIHEDALTQGARVLIIDDLLATGGTVRAVADLVQAQGAKIIGVGFVIELVDLKGRDKLKEYPLVSLIKFRGE
jgi:adenine phosphoribosyltransferase